MTVANTQNNGSDVKLNFSDYEAERKTTCVFFSNFSYYKYWQFSVYMHIYLTQLCSSYFS
jgi:hypothetical protein